MEWLFFRTMFGPCLGPCLAQLYFQTSQSTEIFDTESKWSKEHLYVVSIFWDHVWPSLTSRPARAMKFSTLNLNCLRPISMECLFFGTMSGPCSDHVRPSFTSRPPRALKFSTLNLHGLRTISMECLIFRTMLGPCLAQLYFQISQSTEIFNTESKLSKDHLYGVSIFGDHVGTMFGLALLPDQLEH